MKDVLKHIDSLKAALSKLQPVSAENEQKLYKKFRLEWNYNSNHIEGNTLTYGETELLLIFGETKGNHEFREYEEMKGHDVALKLVEDLAGDTERTLSENFIRELNKIILKEPFYKEAITPDGQPTRRLIKIGEYKSFPNSVRLQNGEIFNYASPAETPLQMGDLVKWYLDVSADKTVHPIELAAELHYRFVCIHPFDDGNGRISRLIMNYHLLKNNYPPVIIKSADKKNYLFALHEADTGNLEAFKIYIAEQLVWSYEISIKAAKGESIDEPGDWEKKTHLLETKFKANNHLQRIKSGDSLFQFLNGFCVPLFTKLLDPKLSLNKLFLSTTLLFKPSTSLFQEFSVKDANQLKGYFDGLFKPDLKKLDRLNSMFFILSFNDFKLNGKKSFAINCNLLFLFERHSCSISLTDSTTISSEKNIIIKLLDKLYHEEYSETDLNSVMNPLFDYVEKQINERTSHN